jgi:hypothetical protein
LRKDDISNRSRLPNEELIAIASGGLGLLIDG